MTSVALSAVASSLDDIRLGVVCPMANEAATAVDFVDAVLSECERFSFRSITMFVVVDLVSHDDTRGVLDRHRRRRPQLRVVWAPETRGVSDAYVRGYREAIAAGCDWILEIDAGFSHDPADIGAFVDAMTDGCDCVFGSRFIAGGRNRATRRRRLISRAGTTLTNALLGTSLTDMTSGFQLFTRQALELVLADGIRSKGPFFQTEMKVHGRNLRTAEVPIRYQAGTHGVGIRAISESLETLARLVVTRLAGEL